jgi:hypothetical protein
VKGDDAMRSEPSQVAVKGFPRQQMDRDSIGGEGIEYDQVA